MLITNSNLDALRTTFSAQFAEAYKNIEPWYEKFCSTIPSSSKSNTYGFAAMQTALREWLGPRQATNLSEHQYTIVNKKYEGTIELDRTDIEDDNLGIFSAVTVPGLAQAAKKHPDQLVAALITANPNGFDGVSLFNDSHPNFNTTGIGATTYDNNFTERLDGTGFNAVWSAMASIVGENGQPLLINPTLLIVPPQLKYKATTLMNSTFYALPGGSTNGAANSATVENQFKGWCEVLVVPELASAPLTWYLADVSKPIRPIVYQDRDPVQLVSRQNPDDPKVFDLDKFTYGVRCRRNVGVGLPFLIAKSVDPGT